MGKYDACHQRKEGCRKEIDSVNVFACRYMCVSLGLADFGNWDKCVCPNIGLLLPTSPANCRFTFFAGYMLTDCKCKLIRLLPMKQRKNWIGIVFKINGKLD